MGLVKGAVNFVRYSVEGTIPDDFWNFAAERIRAMSFKDIDDTLDEYSVGWVSVYEMFDSRFDYNAYAAGDYVVLTMRADERKVSPALLNKFTAKEEARIKREKEVPRLSRTHRTEIKEQVRQMLVGKSIPVPAVYDLCWSLAENTVLFFSSNKKAMGVMEDLFQETFGLHLILQPPYLTAQHLLAPEQHRRLADLGPALFAGGSGR
jgi:DNA recombination-dependent growth factor C